MKYIFVLYNTNYSAISAEHIKSRSAADVLATYNKLYNIFKSRGLKSLLARLHNKWSTVLKGFLLKNTLSFQLVSIHNHNRNSSQQAIGILNNNFIAGVASLDPTSPM